jgi:hypothetical protein
MKNPKKVENYKLEICNELNRVGFKCYRDTDFDPANFETIKELFHRHVIYDPNIYAYAVQTNLIHRDFCPLCGDDLGPDFGHFSLFGRVYYMCDACYKESAPNRNNKEGCFIATACYLNYDHPDVLVLRSFRDDFLIKNKLGKSFVEYYYRVSPPIAVRLKKNTVLSTSIRILIFIPLVAILKLNLKNIKKHLKKSLQR